MLQPRDSQQNKTWNCITGSTESLAWPDMASEWRRGSALVSWSKGPWFKSRLWYFWLLHQSNIENSVASFSFWVLWILDKQEKFEKRPWVISELTSAESLITERPKQEFLTWSSQQTFVVSRNSKAGQVQVPYWKSGTRNGSGLAWIPNFTD